MFFDAISSKLLGGRDFGTLFMASDLVPKSRPKSGCKKTQLSLHQSLSSVIIPRLEIDFFAAHGSSRYCIKRGHIMHSLICKIIFDLINLH